MSNDSLSVKYFVCLGKTRELETSGQEKANSGLFEWNKIFVPVFQIIEGTKDYRIKRKANALFGAIQNMGKFPLPNVSNETDVPNENRTADGSARA